MKHFIYILFFTYLSSTNGQTNLVKNGSFEDSISCPIFLGHVDVSRYWISPTPGTPDYFNSCNQSVLGVPSNGLGWSPAKDGIAYTGIVSFSPLNVREYIEGEFIDTLEFGSKYIISFYASPSDFNHCCNNSIGALISKDLIQSSDGHVLNFTPQISNSNVNDLTDTSSWSLISNSFIANGGEKYIIIGNFLADSLSDTSNVFNPALLVYYFIDYVSVIKDTTTGINDAINNTIFSIYPNPFSSNFKIEFNSRIIDAKINLDIFDITGRLIRTFKVENSNKIIDCSSLYSGIYFLVATFADKSKEVLRMEKI